MPINRPILTFLLFLIVAPIDRAQEATPLPHIAAIAETLYEGMGNSAKMKQAMDSLSSVDRAAIVEYLNQGVRTAGHEPNIYEDVLVNLGDEAAIQREVGSFPSATDGGSTFLLHSIQPKVIEALVPQLIITEPNPRGDGWAGLSRSFFVAETIREIAERSPYFSPDVNKWAGTWESLGRQNPPFAFRDEIRRWWYANEEYLRTGNYESVRPGNPPPGNASQAETPLSMPTPFPRPSIPASTEVLATATPGANAAESAWPLLLTLGGLALAVTSLVVFLKTRK